MSVLHLAVELPRHAFSVRDVARSGDIWRAFQEAAVDGSTQCGWPPARYTAEGCAFVVREQVVVHRRPVHFGEPVMAATFVERFRRGIFTTRLTTLSTGDDVIAAARQEWVHVQNDGQRLRPARASASLLDSFRALETGETLRFPDYIKSPHGAPFTLAFTTWFVRMDPLDHANHPAYVDWCDEALAREVHHRGGVPTDVESVAESVRYRAGVVADERVEIHGRVVGQMADALVFEFEVVVDGANRAEVVFARRLHGASIHALFQVEQAL